MEAVPTVGFGRGLVGLASLADLACVEGRLMRRDGFGFGLALISVMGRMKEGGLGLARAGFYVEWDERITNSGYRKRIVRDGRRNLGNCVCRDSRMVIHRRQWRSVDEAGVAI